MKTCLKCREVKEINEFHKNKNFKDGCVNTCKKCISEQSKEYYKNNINKRSEQSKQSYLRNKEKSKSRANDYYHKNKSEISEKRKVYREKNENKIKSQKKKYYQENKDKIKKKTSEYAKNNRDKVNNYKLKYDKKNTHLKAWRSILKSQLRRFNTTKESHTLELLKYSAEDLKLHLESLFTPNMSWSNYGEWHVDHINPISKFDKNTPPHIVNALSNLQPLWATTREIDGIIYEGNINKGS